MSQDDTNEQKGFSVRDRRRFTATGEPRSAPDSGVSEPTGSDQAAAREISFSGFVIGLAQQAFVALGVVVEQGPDTQPQRDLAQAKAMIDVLSMLRDKTKGNLDEVESRMMDEVLDELRLRYVREHRGVKKDRGA